MSKIVDVTFELKKYEYFEPFRITNSTRIESNNIEVKITLDNGSIGMGESSPSYRVNGEKIPALLTLQDTVKEMISGYDVRNYARIFNIMDGLSRTAPSLKAAVQYATLDALSVLISMPVYQILGGVKDKIQIDKTIGIDTLEKMVEKARRTFDEGFKTLKVKVGENLKEDIEKMLAISEAVPDAEYIIDANQGYTPKESIRFAQCMYEKGINMVLFEQPVMWNDFDGLKLVRYNSPFPIAADESAKTKYDVYELIRNDCVDFVNIKLMKSGISDALSIVELAKASNTGLMIGCMGESSIGINQSVHFAAGTGAFSYHDLDSHLMLREKFRGKFDQKVDVLMPSS